MMSETHPLVDESSAIISADDLAVIYEGLFIYCREQRDALLNSEFEGASMGDLGEDITTALAEVSTILARNPLQQEDLLRDLTLGVARGIASTRRKYFDQALGVH